ncbi:hypothetical protein QRX50_12850 [Amycolatopsis carbonis]|uniref:Uncharacterized protein n=1 Tax=Amycolatopsis carbonis TaxID=715471 RepID=A0A9Y2IJN4_9PSEU|nr:hypothetical protein [Amycolatopsis sp. 2-15]WIX81575.1 hypothetical protein QRX50_12850 [Amycolatopsis sp. 2-15]
MAFCHGEHQAWRGHRGYERANPQRFWLSPLQDTCAELREAGFLIERLLEPRPQAAATDVADVDPGRY